MGITCGDGDSDMPGFPPFKSALAHLPEWFPGGDRNPIRYSKKRGLGSLFGPPYVKWFLHFQHGQLEPVRLETEFTSLEEIEHDACIERMNGRLVDIDLNSIVPKNTGLFVEKSI